MLKFFVFVLLLILLELVLSKQFSNCKHNTIKEENVYQRAGRLTYEHFQKASNDAEMIRFLIANDQNPKDFEGYSRKTICERMKQKAELTGKAYTHWPF